MEHIHSLCLVEGNNDKAYLALYDKISQYASQNYAVIYAVENDARMAVRRMSRHGVEVEALVESGALTIVDRNLMYSVEKTDLEGHALLNSWQSLMLKVKRRSHLDRILAIGSAETFFEQAVGPCKLVKYEEMIGKKFNIPLEAICCYSGNAFSKLSFGELVAILNAHHSTIHSGCRYREWSAYRLVELARKGLDKALGKELSSLIFKTMKLCYKISDDDIVSNPPVLEEMLKRIMGKSAADITLTYVKGEVREFIAFN